MKLNLEIIFSLLSLVWPIWLIFNSDKRGRKERSNENVVVIYPLLIIIYFVARGLLIYGYYFVNFWTDVMIGFSKHSQYIGAVSQLIVFTIDSGFWYFFSKSKFKQNNLKIATSIVFILMEATVLILVGMVVPVMADTILELILG